MTLQAYDVLLQFDNELLHGVIAGDLATQHFSGQGKVCSILTDNYQRAKMVQQPVIY